MNPNLSPETFTTALEREPSRKGVFNPYADWDPLIESAEAPILKANNLCRFLHGAISRKKISGVPLDLWIGRDLGYLGGRRTGVALTDDITWGLFADYYDREARLGRPISSLGEMTAGAVWEMIVRIHQQGKRSVFTWNVYPFHPHAGQKDQCNNRAHTADERKIGIRYLKALITLLQPSQLLCLGVDAYKTVCSEGLACYKVRHPAHGGQKEFRRQVAAIYQISIEDEGLRNED